jgi:hypothetical protein
VERRIDALFEIKRSINGKSAGRPSLTNDLPELVERSMFNSTILSILVRDANAVDHEQNQRKYDKRERVNQPLRTLHNVGRSLLTVGNLTHIKASISRPQNMDELFYA